MCVFLIRLYLKVVIRRGLCYIHTIYLMTIQCQTPVRISPNMLEYIVQIVIKIIRTNKSSEALRTIFKDTEIADKVEIENLLSRSFFCQLIMHK